MKILMDPYAKEIALNMIIIIISIYSRAHPI